MVEHLEACPEWQEDLAAWAVAQGSPEREAALVAHMEGATDAVPRGRACWPSPPWCSPPTPSS